MLSRKCKTKRGKVEVQQVQLCVVGLSVFFFFPCLMFCIFFQSHAVDQIVQPEESPTSDSRGRLHFSCLLGEESPSP